MIGHENALAKRLLCGVVVVSVWCELICRKDVTCEPPYTVIYTLRAVNMLSALSHQTASRQNQNHDCQIHGSASNVTAKSQS